LKQGGERWARGRIVQIMSSPDGAVRLNVFLLDYGRIMRDVNGRGDVRALPKRFSAIYARPMAERVVLAGLRPLTLDINYGMGMKSLCRLAAGKWTPNAFYVVQKHVEEYPARLAELSHFAKNNEGVLFGTVTMQNASSSINEHLIVGGFASYTEEAFLQDVNFQRWASVGQEEDEMTSELVPMMATLCGVGCSSSSGSSFSETTSEAESSFHVPAPPGKVMYIGLQWINQFKPHAPPEQTETDLNASSSSGSTWDAYRTAGGSSVVADEAANTIVVPAGVDPGKFLEEQLRRVKNSGMGPKRVKRNTTIIC